MLGEIGEHFDCIIMQMWV